MDDAQDRDGLMALGFIAEGIGDDVGHAAQYFFIGAGHPALASGGRGRERLNGSVDTDGDVAGGDGIVLRDITDDAAKIIVGVLRPDDPPHRWRLFGIAFLIVVSVFLISFLITVSVFLILDASIGGLDKPRLDPIEDSFSIIKFLINNIYV